MNCDEVRRSIQDYVTRELSSENRRLFDAHLVECAECQRELALMAAVVSTLDHQPVLEPPADFSARVLGNLPRQREFAPSPWVALFAAPLLGGLAFLLRRPVVRFVSGWLGQVGPSHVTIPSFTLQQAGLVAAAVVLAGVAVAVSAGVYVWKEYLRA
jgi:anti-sigma factor RsiW